jgi:hypothetical protein
MMRVDEKKESGDAPRTYYRFGLSRFGFYGRKFVLQKKNAKLLESLILLHVVWVSLENDKTFQNMSQ